MPYRHDLLTSARQLITKIASFFQSQHIDHQDHRPKLGHRMECGMPMRLKLMSHALLTHRDGQ